MRQLTVARPRARHLVIRASAIAIAAVIAAPALADCTPYPTQENVTTHCTGATAGELVVDKSNATLSVDTGASVTGGSPAAVTLTNGAASAPEAQVALRVDGIVDGQTFTGVRVQSGPGGSYPYSGTRATITVGSGGSVAGSTAIVVDQAGDNPYGTAFASIVNDGTITAASGAALVAANADGVGFLSIDNHAGGVLGGVSGRFETITNAGRIDGGSVAALDFGGLYSNYIRYSTIINNGTITSASQAATIGASAVFGSFITNNATITNTGAGSALSGSAIALSNAVGATISAAGGTALSVGNIALTNRGTIVGNVVADYSNYQSTTIDSTGGGRIEGNVQLGGGDDVLVASFVDNRFVNGITGTIDGGAGNDTVRVAVGADTLIDAPIVLPTNFETLGFAVTNGATVTLGSGFTSPIAINLMVDGPGGLINEANLTTTGPAIIANFNLSGVTRVDNRGTVSADMRATGGAGIQLNGSSVFNNSGTVNVAGGSGIFQASGTGFANTGTIQADDTGASASGPFLNSGTIVSRQTIGAVLSGSGTNSGLIEGGTAGARTGVLGTLTNSGTIRGGAVGVQLDIYGSLYNQAGGVIDGGTQGGVTTTSGFTFFSDIFNAGTINGSVDFGSIGVDTNNAFVALPGGVLNGDLHLNSGRDIFVTDLANTGPGQFAGVTGTVSAGGTDSIYFRVASDSAASLAPPAGFANVGFQVLNDTTLTLTGNGTQTTPVLVSGSGTVDLTADISRNDGPLIALNGLPVVPGESPPTEALTVISHGTLTATPGENAYVPAVVMLGDADNFTNTGTIILDASNSRVQSAAVSAGGTVTNSGAIMASGGIGVEHAAALMNSGVIEAVSEFGYSIGVDDVANVNNSGRIAASFTAVNFRQNGNLVNTGLISSDLSIAVSGINLTIDNRAGGTIEGSPYTGSRAVFAYSAILSNEGAIEGDIDLRGSDFSSPDLVSNVTNLGTINGNVGLGRGDDMFTEGASAALTGIADGGEGSDSLTIDATGDGTIDAGHFINFESITQIGTGNVTYSGDFSVYPTINLQGGTITVAPGTTLATSGPVTITGWDAGVAVRNDGRIAGGVTLGAGSDSVVNNGVIGGAVSLGAGDDSFTEGSGSSVAGGVDGGDGFDTYSVVLAGDRTGIGARSNFEALAVQGTGTLHLTLDQDFASVSLGGAGLDLRTSGFSVGSIHGSDAAETLTLDHDLPSVDLGGGDDTLALSAATLNGAYAGGAGTDTLRLTSATPVTLGGTVTGFETVLLAGGVLTVSGTLGAAGDTISFGDGAQQVTIAAGASVPATLDLGAGDDALTIAGAAIPGTFLGGAGNDTLRMTSAVPVTLSGEATGFETVALASGVLTVSGTLGAAGDTIAFGDGAQALTIADGGTLTGTVDLGEGDDSFRLAARGTLAGTVSGGAGANDATIELAGDRTIDGGQLQNFASLATTGTGTLVFGSGAASFGRVNSAGSLTVAAGASLDAPQVQFGSGDDRFTLAGRFAGSADGGAGSDTVLVSGGTAAAPVSFGSLSNFETLQMSDGFATVSGTARFNTLVLGGGRLVGLAGSTIAAPQINVGTGATFGSAGVIVGNVAVAGMLSPGASPGIMSVTGNVALAGGSNSLFEFTPAVSDKLLVSGAVMITSGASLTLTGERPLTPGVALDLIVADGGITGSFTTVSKPPTILGFLSQSGTRLQLLGTFQNDARFARQVQSTIAYVNSVLTSGAANSGLLAAVPLLLTPSGASNPVAFARLTPEAYADARHIAVESGLNLADGARARPLVSGRGGPGLFTFGEALGDWRDLKGGRSSSATKADLNGYGFLGGIGYDGGAWGVGAFGGYLHNRQHLDALAARTDANGAIAGVQARYRSGGFTITGLVAYDSGDARTRRAVPGGSTTGRYDLHGWTFDASAAYDIAIGGGFALQPNVGATAISARRGAVSETGSAAFDLAVARDRRTPVFVDGGLKLHVTDGQTALRPYAQLGARYQFNGREPIAIASLGGGGFGLEGIGAARARVTGTLDVGAEWSVVPGLTFFANYRGERGERDHQDGVRGGLRIGL